MKLPSLAYLVQSAKKSFLRFPLTIISSLVAVIIGIYLTEFRRETLNVFPYINVMLCAALGIPLFFCVRVFSDNKGLSKKVRLLLELGALIILVILYFTFPNSDSTQNTSLPYIRYAIYNITIHLLVAFIPFINAGQLNGFWHYNKILFVRFLTSLLYSAFLYGGLALALGSLDFLFDIDLHDELFFDLFILIAGFFNTWFFVSGIPERFDALDEIREYPKGIKIFSQYVLLPLLILYLLILYIYASKIVFLWSWPKGIVSYLIACVAVLGILTLLLIHPYGNLPGNTWIKKFSKAYYFILFPLVVLLFIAIGMRIADYGITINRYIILLLGIWLTLVCIYFVVGKTNIKFIPISLAVILIVVSFGYWGMFSVSERSQVNRLKKILEQGGILESGKIQREVIWNADSLPLLYAVHEEGTNSKSLNDSLHNEVKSIVDYLDDHHGFASIRKWYQQDIDSIVRKANNTNKERWRNLNEAEAYMRSMGLKYYYRYKSDSDLYFSYQSFLDNDVIDVSNYDYLIAFDKNVYDEAGPDTSSFYLGKKKYFIRHSLHPDDKLFLISPEDTIQFNTNEIIAKLVSKYGYNHTSDIADSLMRLHISRAGYTSKMELHTIAMEIENDTLRINSISGNLFIKLKK